MSDGTYRGRWVDEIFRSDAVSAEVKVFLLFLDRYGYVSDAGRISEPRDNLAKIFGCHSRKVSAKFASAISSGLLRQAMRGQKHVTAVYQAVVPGIAEPPQGASNRPAEASQGAGYRPAEAPQGASNRHPETDPQGDKNRHPETEKTPQGADTRPAEDVSGCQQTAPHIHSEPDASDHAEDAVVLPLFEESNSTQKKNTQRAKASDLPDRFEEFWRIYPRHLKRDVAKKAWDKAIKDGADPEGIIWGARRYASDPRRKAADLQFTAHGSTWLNQKRWLDEAEPEPEQQAAGGYRPYSNPVDQSVYHEDF